MKYQGNILSIGANVSELGDEQMLIFFGEQATGGLEDYSYIVPVPEKAVELSVGDCIVIAGIDFPVTAMGNKAMETFNSLGHFTVRFDGNTQAILPGTVHLQGELPDLAVGDTIEFRGAADGS